MNKFARKGADRMTAVLERARDYAAPLTATPETIPVSLIDANPDQPRRHFDEAALQDLTRSIEAQGILQPILVRPVGNRYQIVFGERRFRAALRAGLTTVPAMVKAVADADVPVVAALENLQRHDLNRFEQVRAKVQLTAEMLGLRPDEVPAHLKRLRAQPDEHMDDVQAVERLFSQLGGEQWRSFVVNGLPVLNLPDPMRAAVESGQLAYSKALLIGRVPAVHHQALVRDTLAEGWTQLELQRQIKLLSSAPSVDAVSALKRRLTSRRMARLTPEQRQEAERLMLALHTLLD
ncbi:ParB/RepB/Spo0J family partition protein [Deinococcus daejeonensis]|uniref:Plasmid-partitioning protein ParB n=1 Tax=Deinococcus daejeonensis TaxID=1007098 RepID=A0ABQ2JC61_9DEIO|nr:ParB/RepB/Spo0J family partition protein [Deinococcus daejeonensis]GGN43461.1 putative plasmid-partitioning protein ParB [Deinococcus daejeonensis]